MLTMKELKANIDQKLKKYFPSQTMKDRWIRQLRVYKGLSEKLPKLDQQKVVTSSNNSEQQWMNRINIISRQKQRKSINIIRQPQKARSPVDQFQERFRNIFIKKKYDLTKITQQYSIKKHNIICFEEKLKTSTIFNIKKPLRTKLSYSLQQSISNPSLKNQKTPVFDRTINLLKNHQCKLLPHFHQKIKKTYQKQNIEIFNCSLHSKKQDKQLKKSSKLNKSLNSDIPEFLLSILQKQIK